MRVAGLEVGTGGAAPDTLRFGAGVQPTEDCGASDTGLVVGEDGCLFHGILLSVKEAELGGLWSVAVAADNIVIVCVDGLSALDAGDAVVAVTMVFRVIDELDHNAVLAVAFVFPFVCHDVSFLPCHHQTVWGGSR
jgi:hypothetical protein